MRTLVALPVLFAGLLPLGPQPFAACPTDTLIVCDVTVTSSAPSYLVLGCLFNGSAAAYDLILGQLSAGANGRSADVTVTTRDIYRIIGPASSLPVAFSAQFEIHAGLVHYGIVKGEIRSSDGVQAAQLGPCGCGLFGANFSRTLVLPLARAVGEQFDLALKIRSVSPFTRVESHAQGTGNLAFTLPPGYSVTSCQGYTSTPTSTRAMAWGRLKVIYR